MDNNFVVLDNMFKKTALFSMSFCIGFLTGFSFGFLLAIIGDNMNQLLLVESTQLFFDYKII